MWHNPKNHLHEERSHCILTYLLLQRLLRLFFSYKLVSQTTFSIHLNFIFFLIFPAFWLSNSLSLRFFWIWNYGREWRCEPKWLYKKKRKRFRGTWTKRNIHEHLYQYIVNHGVSWFCASCIWISNRINCTVTGTDFIGRCVFFFGNDILKKGDLWTTHYVLY